MNLEIYSNLFCCLDRYIIVYGLRYVSWFDRSTVFRVQCFLSFLDFDLRAVDFMLMEVYDCTEGFLLCVFTDLISLLKSLSAPILALALYCWISGQVPLSVCLFRDLVAPSAWLMLSSVDRVWL